MLSGARSLKRSGRSGFAMNRRPEADHVRAPRVDGFVGRDLQCLSKHASLYRLRLVYQQFSQGRSPARTTSHMVIQRHARPLCLQCAIGKSGERTKSWPPAEMKIPLNARRNGHTVSRAVALRAEAKVHILSRLQRRADT